MAPATNSKNVPQPRTNRRQKTRGRVHPRRPHQADHVADSVAEVAELEQRGHTELTPGDRLSDMITAFAGSMLFVWLHVAWFGAWILLNLPIIGLEFDGFPFSFLTMVVSLEAIFLSTFVLISQNRDRLQADRRSRVDLEVNVIAEREITKVMEMVADIHRSLNGASHDPEAERMRRRTSVAELAVADEAEERRSGGNDKAAGQKKPAQT